jgi:hypothetical protein
MAWLEIPTRSDIPAYSFKIQLEKTTYQITLTFNDRMNKWTMTLANNIGEPFVSPVPLAVNWDLFGRFAYSGMPPGKFYAFSTDGTFVDPARFDLGGRVKLLYRESTTT